MLLRKPLAYSLVVLGLTVLLVAHFSSVVSAEILNTTVSVVVGVSMGGGTVLYSSDYCGGEAYVSGYTMGYSSALGENIANNEGVLLKLGDRGEWSLWLINASNTAVSTTVDSMAIIDNNRIAVAGIYYNGTMDSLFIAVYEKNGDLVWAKRILFPLGTTINVYQDSLVVSGDYLLYAVYQGAGIGAHPMLLNISISDGSIQYIKKYSYSRAQIPQPIYSLASNSKGESALLTLDYQNKYIPILFKLDGNGYPEWALRISSPSFIPIKTLMSEEGDIYIVGDGLTVVKIFSNGTIDWAYRFINTTISSLWTPTDALLVDGKILVAGGVSGRIETSLGHFKSVVYPLFMNISGNMAYYNALIDNNLYNTAVQTRLVLLDGLPRISSVSTSTDNVGEIFYTSPTQWSGGVLTADEISGLSYGLISSWAQSMGYTVEDSTPVLEQHLLQPETIAEIEFRVNATYDI